MLTQTQIDALRWIDAFPHTRVRWMRKGKAAYGPPQMWDAIELSGERGSIRISVGDWKAIKEFRRTAGIEEQKTFALNDVGRAALDQQ